jgi:hypothetical protein
VNARVQLAYSGRVAGRQLHVVERISVPDEKPGWVVVAGTHPFHQVGDGTVRATVLGEQKW